MGFFGGALAYNTITSPEQEAAAAAGGSDEITSGAQDRGNDTTSTTQDSSLSRIMSAVMRSAAIVQGQEQAKKVVSDQARDRSKMTVTIKQNPFGGPPLVTAKDVPSDVLNGTSQQDVADAYSTPMKQVEAKVGDPSSASRTAPPPTDHPLEQAAAALEANGMKVVRPWSPELRDSVTSEQALVDMAKRLDVPNAEKVAKDAYSRIRKGKLNPDVTVGKLQEFATRKLESESKNLQATLGDFQEQKIRQQAEADRQATQKRLMQSLTDQEQERVLKHKDEIRKNTDWTLVAPEQVAQTADEQNQSGVPFSPQELKSIESTRRRQIADKFQKFTEPKGPGVFSLGDYPSWDAAKAAFGHDLTQTFGATVAARMDKSGYAAWDSAHKYALRKAADDAAQQELRGARLEAIQLRIEKASETKPEKLSPTDVDLMTADELLSQDSTKIKDYDRVLTHKSDRLRKQIQKLDDEAKLYGSQANAISAKKPYEMQGGDPEQLAGYRMRTATANREKAEAQAELAKIDNARARRLTPSSNVQPSPQQTPTAGPPVVRYRPVANGQYAPQVEQGIRAHMQKNNVGRGKAIEQLRAAGYLE